MLVLVVGLVIFLGVHSVSIVAPGWRTATVARLGERPWKGLYSLASAVGLALIVIGYGMARRDPVVLYTPPAALRHLALVVMLPVFPLLFAAYLPGRIRAAAKHPFLLAVKLWALAHLLANGMLADVLLFGGFLAWAVADRISVKRRPARADARGAGGAAGRGQRRDRAGRRAGRLRRVHRLGAPLDHRRLAASADRARASASNRRVVAVRAVGRASDRGGAVSPQRHRVRDAAQPSPLARRARRCGRGGAVQGRAEERRSRRQAAPGARSLPAATCRSTTAPRRSRSVPRSAS